MELLYLYLYISCMNKTVFKKKKLVMMMIMMIMIYLSTAIGLTPIGSSTVHIYTETIHRTTQLTTLVGRLSGIRTQNVQTKN
jgi:uncharacterized integral membrane protein